jgi:hypothetical protein
MMEPAAHAEEFITIGTGVTGVYYPTGVRSAVWSTKSARITAFAARADRPSVARA